MLEEWCFVEHSTTTACFCFGCVDFGAYIVSCSD